MRRIMILSGLLACLGSPLAARDEAPPGAAPESETAAPRPDRRRALAARLAALVGFASDACPDVRGDPDLLAASVRRLGIDPDDLDRGEFAPMVRAYREAYAKDVPGNCQRAIETFGASSTLVPDLILRRGAGRPGND